MLQENTPDIASLLASIDVRLAAVEQLLVQQKTIKDWYTTAETAAILGKSEYTVREWCRQGRVQARKRACGRGRAKEWVISHDELTRLRNDGLRPV